MKITGKTLKESREHQGLTIGEIASVTKINPKVIEAIEDGDLTRLPKLSYLKGFIRAYAKTLKLDESAVLKQFNEETQVIEEPSLVPDDLKDNKDHTDAQAAIENQGRRNLGNYVAVVSVLILVVAIIMLKSVIDKYRGEAVVETKELEKIEPLAPPASPSARETIDPAAAKVANEATTKSKTSEVVAPADSSRNDQDTTAEAPTAPSSGEPEIDDPKLAESPPDTAVQALKPTAPSPAADTKKSVEPPTPSVANTNPRDDSALKSELSPQRPQEATPSSDGQSKPAVSPQAVLPAKKPQVSEVIIEALDTVTLAYSINGSDNTEVKLRPDQTHVIKLVNSTSLRFSDGGAVSVIVNGKDRGVPGDLGKPIQVVYP